MKRIIILGSTGAAGTSLVQDLKSLNLFHVEEPSQTEYWEANYPNYDNVHALVLCLPYDISVAWLQQHTVPENVLLIDCSFDNRLNPDWYYGYLYNPKLDTSIFQTVKRIANPGCFATGMQLILSPLTSTSEWDASLPLTFAGCTGYSAGGKPVMARQQLQPTMARHSNLLALHGHTKEVQHHLKLQNPVILDTTTVNIARGQSVVWQIHESQLPSDLHEWHVDKWVALFNEYYTSYPEIRTSVPASNGLSLDTQFAEVVSLKKGIAAHIYISKIEGWLRIQAVYDNLGIGSSGNIARILSLSLPST